MFIVRPVYMIFVMVYKTVGVLHPSRVVRRRGAVGIWGGVFPAAYRYVDWGRNNF